MATGETGPHTEPGSVPATTWTNGVYNPGAGSGSVDGMYYEAAAE